MFEGLPLVHELRFFTDNSSKCICLNDILVDDNGAIVYGYLIVWNHSTKKLVAYEV